MMPARLVALTAAVLLACPHGADAWGHDVHRFIMDRAIALLPAELRPLFERHRAIVVERSIDPDTWRTAGFAGEDPHHFLHFDWEGYGPYPFEGLPREYAAAVAAFGRARIEANGTLPWRVEEYHGNLRRAFEAYRRPSALSRFNVLFFAAALSHYVSDAHVPFHAALNYDGHLTGQHGLHARFESVLFERFRTELMVAPRALPPVGDPRAFIFGRLLESTRFVPALLRHDLTAIGSRDVYDDAYYQAFFTAARPVLERRLGESIASVAAMIAGAWEAGGRPAAPADPPPPPPQRRRR